MPSNRGFDLDEGPILKEWGFNVVRLGVMWPGVEPEPGQVDQGHLVPASKAEFSCF